MYKLSDKQVDYILDDIRSRGIVMERLQDDLLDHICCLIEIRMQDGDDFHSFYSETIRTFYKTELSEIEFETIALLTFKNYYTMKKMMILSGLFSAFTMIVGIWFKLMHYPGAAILLPVGIMWGSFVFMPLLFTLKAKEKQTVKDKLILAAGGLAILLIGLSFIVKLLGGPTLLSVPMYLFYLSAAVTLTAFLPFYLSSGLRNPATKVNTLVTAVLIVMGYTLFFSMTFNARYAPKNREVQTYDFVRSQQILSRERLLADLSKTAAGIKQQTISRKIDQACEQVKAALLELETGHKTIDEDFGSQNILLIDHSVYLNDPYLNSGISELRDLVPEYNAALTGSLNKIPLQATFLEQGENKMEVVSFISLLTQLTHVQMLMLQNERELLANR